MAFLYFCTKIEICLKSIWTIWIFKSYCWKQKARRYN